MIVLALTLVIPLVSFFFGHTLVRQLTRCREPDSMNPDHEMLLEVYEELFACDWSTGQGPALCFAHSDC